ncbi:MAG: hypothetical protein ABIK68_14030 [bacterium]
MNQKMSVFLAFVSVLFLSAGFAFAANQNRTEANVQTQEQEEVYGRQLMTQQELAEHRSNMRAAKTVEARTQIRNEQHERMNARAKTLGKTLPDQPSYQGRGMGQGSGGRGQGRGMGPGGGNGPGSGTGPGGGNGPGSGR